jgi:small conductance mechanosensitive channel
VGDRIDVGVASGQVERVTLRVTQLRDDEGTVWYVPNGRIDRVANKTQGYATAILDVGVAHGTDVARAADAIRETARALVAEPTMAPLVLQGPEGPDGVQAFDSEKVVLRISVRVRPGSQWKLLRALRARLLEALPAAGVGLPVSTGVVTSEGAPAETAPSSSHDDD